MAIRSIIAAMDKIGLRLDQFLAAECPDITRSRAASLIKQGHVRAAGQPVVNAAYRIRAEDAFEVEVPEPEPAEPAPEAIPLTILYEDAALIVIDKPAGLVVHPAAGNWTGTLVNALIAHCGDSLSGIGGVRRPGIVHRLDKDTTGVMVVAKTDAAHRGLAAQFADHGREGALLREYRALAWGRPLPLKGEIETQIARHPHNRLKMAVIRRDGKYAHTAYSVRLSFPEDGKSGAEAIASLVDCTLLTGRTHQIRVHMAHIGHPIIGDDLYGSGFRSKTRALPEKARSAIMMMARQALHAAVLGFVHPISKEFLRFESELPEDMRQIVEALR
jgi:23S rRNA pseudouridine1911/1915/1917 synthase